jgi:uncharacterized coiled-coil protein SlyX
MSDDSDTTTSPVVDYLTREANQASLRRGLESLGDALAESVDNGESEQVQRRLDQLDSRLDDFDERLTSLEESIDSQNDVLSQLVEAVETLQEGMSKDDHCDSSPSTTTRSEGETESGSDTPSHDDDSADIVENGAMILQYGISAHYVLHLEVDGETLTIGIELEDGSGHATIESDSTHHKIRRPTRVKNGQLEFKIALPRTMSGLVTYRFQSKRRNVSVFNSDIRKTESYQIVSAKPK